MPKVYPARQQSRIGFPSPYGSNIVFAIVFFEPTLAPPLHKSLICVAGAQCPLFGFQWKAFGRPVNFRNFHVRNFHNVEFFLPLQKGPRWFGNNFPVTPFRVFINLLTGNLKDRTNETTLIFRIGIFWNEFFCRKRGEFFCFNIGESALEKDGCWVAKNPPIAIRDSSQSKINQVWEGRPGRTLAQQTTQAEYRNGAIPSQILLPPDPTTLE